MEAGKGSVYYRVVNENGKELIIYDKNYVEWLEKELIIYKDLIEDYKKELAKCIWSCPIGVIKEELI